jgi:hypothetical protein
MVMTINIEDPTLKVIFLRIRLFRCRCVKHDVLLKFNNINIIKSDVSYNVRLV